MKPHHKKASSSNPSAMKRVWRLSILTGSIAAIVAQSASANPAGEEVIRGAADFTRAGKNLTVKAGDNSIIHWQDFSIGRGEATRFVQPGKGSVSLNRVVSGTPSELLGRLSANGDLILINPNGVLVGEGARINVGGFTASTLDLSDNEFLRGADLTFSGDSTASVINRGTIKAVGGDVFLFGKNVENSGKISAARGTVGLAAGSEILLKQSGDERISVRPKGAGKVVNKGIVEAVRAELKAHGNAYALAINNEGVVRATGAVKRGGRVMLTAGGGGAIQNSGKISAKHVNGAGGRIVMDAGLSGRVVSSGKISAKGSAGKKGGEVQILGSEVELAAGSLVDVSGGKGGGSALIGGDYQGGNAAVPNATKTTVAAGATIHADAGAKGKGGRVIIWADDTTIFSGSISAKGGAFGGDGGFVETSGKITLQADGTVVASATKGNAGTWLLDPSNLYINTGGSSSITGGSPFTSASGASYLRAGDLQTALNSGTNVIVQTGAAGTEKGFIDWQAGSVTRSASGAGSLTLIARDSITIGSGVVISQTGIAGADTLNVILNADRDGAGGGAIYLRSGAQILTNGGNITLGGGASPDTTAARGVDTTDFASYGAFGFSPTQKGVFLDAATLSAAGGNISILGAGTVLSGRGASIGVDISGGTAISTTGTGSITIDGTGGPVSDGFSSGVSIFSGSTITAQNGAISVTGSATATGAGSYGLKLHPSSMIQATGGGSIIATTTAGDLAVDGIVSGSGANNVTLTVNGSDHSLTLGSSGAISSGTGTISLSAPGTISVGDGSITTAGNATLTADNDANATGAITSGTGLITANLITASAAQGIALKTTASTLAATNLTSGAITINETNSLAVNRINAGTGNVTINANGILTDGNGLLNNFAANSLTLNATGGFTGIETAVTTFSASSTNAAIGILQAGDLAIGLINAGNGTVNLTSLTGALTDTNAAANNITGSTLTLTAATGMDLDITASFLFASITGTGSIHLSDLSGGLDVLGATTNNGAITLHSIGGNLTLTGVDAGNGGALNLSTTTSGNIFLDDATTTGAATISAVGFISESGTGDSDVDLSADTVTFSASTGIGTAAAGPLETALGTVTTATTASGGIALRNIGALTLGTATVTTSGDITLTSASDDSAIVTILPGSITVTGAVSTPGNITLTATEYDDAVIPFTNEITIAAGATVTGNLLTLQSGDDLTIAAGATVRSTGLMTLYAGTNDLDDQGDLHLFGTINPLGGLSMTAFGDVGVGTISAPGQTISITSLGGLIFDQNDSTTPPATTVMNVTAATLNLSAQTGIGAFGNTIETTVQNLTATNGAQGGIYIYNTGALSAGAIHSDSATPGDDIEITTTGAMNVLGPVTQTGGQNITFFATAATLPLATASNLTVNGPISTSGGTGNITLSAANQVSLGANSALTLAGTADLTLNAGWPNGGNSNANADLTISAALHLGAANLVLTASRDVILNGSTVDITTTGLLTVEADRDASANGTGGSFIQNAVGSTILVSGVDITAADISLSGIIDADTGNIAVKPSRLASPILLNNTGTGLSLSLTDLLALRTAGGVITIGEAADTGTTSIGGLGTVGLGLINADYTIYGGAIDFNGGISLADDQTLTLHSADTITAAGPGIVDVTIAGAAGTLAINAEASTSLSTLIRNLGTSTVTHGGTLTVHNNNTSLNVSGPISAAAISLITGTATLTVSDTLTAAIGTAGDINITADGLSLDADITGGGDLTIKGATTATPIGLGDLSTGTLNLDIVELAHLLGGFSAIHFGYSGQTGAIEIATPAGNEVIFRDPVTINSSTTTGQIQIKDGSLTGLSDASFALTAKRITFSGAAPGITTNSGIVDIRASMLLTGDTTLTTASGGGADITLTGTIDGPQSLTLDGGSAIVFIKGQSTSAPTGTSVGGLSPLSSLDVTGGVIKLFPNIHTVGEQTYTAPDIRVLNGTRWSSAVGTGNLTFNGDVTLSNVLAFATNDSAITFNGDVFSAPTGRGGLTLATHLGSVLFNGDVGTALLPLFSINLTSASMVSTASGYDLHAAAFLKLTTDELNLLGGADSVHVSGPVSIQPFTNDSAILVGGAESGTGNTLSLSDDDIAAFADGAASILISGRIGTSDMVISTTQSFHDPVTFSTPLFSATQFTGIIRVNSTLHADTANGGFTFRGPSTVLNADILTDGGAIDIQNGVLAATLITLDTSAGDGNVTLSGSLRPSVEGEDLIVLAGAGEIRTTALLGKGLAGTTIGDVTLTTSGETRIEKGFIAESLHLNGTGSIFLKSGITTTGASGQTYQGPVQLLGTTSLYSTDTDGLIHFAATVDSDLSLPTKTFNLSITSRKATETVTAVQFDGALGLAGPLGTLKITTTGEAILAQATQAKTLTLAASAFTVHGVETTFAQNYKGNATFLGPITATKLNVATLGSGGISNVAPWNIEGLTTLNSKLGPITISGPGNHFGELVLRGLSASLEEHGDIALRQASVTGTLNLVSHPFGGETGAITQTTGASLANRFTANSSGSITIDRIGTRFAEIGNVTAAGPITIVLAGSRFTKLDGTITAATGDIVLAGRATNRLSFSASTAAHLIATSGRWMLYTTYASSVSQGYDLLSQLAPADSEAGVLYPDAPASADNVILYRFLSQP